MAHVRKRTLPSGLVRWQARVSSHNDGKRHSTARDFASEREAKAWLRGEGGQREQRGTIGGKGTVAAFFRRWLDHLEAGDVVQAKTLSEYRWRLKRLDPLIGHKRLDRLSPADLDEAYAQLRKRGGRYGQPLHPRTIICTHRVVFTALKRARRWKLIADNPAADVELPAPGRTSARAPTGEELARYLDAARATPLWPIVLAAIATGLRRGELCALQWRNIDMAQAVLRVEQVICETDGRHWLREKPKTPAGFRQVSFPPVLAEELARLRLRQKEETLAYGAAYRRDLDLVFTLPGGAMWQPSRLTRLLSRIARKAGVPKNVAPLHGLRHSHATSLISTVPLKVVSERLGHSSIKMTADIYQHVDEALDRGAAVAIEAVIRPLVTKREPPDGGLGATAGPTAPKKPPKPLI